MGYFWQPISDEENLNEIFRDIDSRYTLRSTNEWYKTEGVKVYGYFSTERNRVTDLLFKSFLRQYIEKIYRSRNQAQRIYFQCWNNMAPVKGILALKMLGGN